MHQFRIIITHIVLLVFLLLLPSNSIRILFSYHKQKTSFLFYYRWIIIITLHFC